MNKSVVAAFDFDGTLTRGDTFLPFLKLLDGNFNYVYRMGRLSPVLIGYGMGMVSNHYAKARVVKQFLSGRQLLETERIAKDFVAQQLPGFINQAALTRLRWHQQQGHRCVLVSASLECYLRPWAQIMGITDVIGTRLQSINGIYTGELLGANCYGVEKASRLMELIGDRASCTLYAYGDSKGDQELLALADFAYYRRIPQA